MSLRLVVIDDNADYRLLVRIALAGAGELDLVGEAGTLAEGAELARQHDPDIVLVDLDIGGPHAASPVPVLREVAPRSAIVVASAYPSADVEAELQRGGRVGHLSKGVRPSQLADALLASVRPSEGDDELKAAFAKLDADLQSAAAARRFVARTLVEWSCDELEDAAVLLVSELVTNAVMHAGSEVEVAVRLLRERIRVEVTDQSTEWVRRRSADAWDGSGRGVEIVEVLSQSWGSEILDGRKVLWFELDRPAAAGE